LRIGVLLLDDPRRIESSPVIESMRGSSPRAVRQGAVDLATDFDAMKSTSG
jgi:hypothetical protein